MMFGKVGEGEPTSGVPHIVIKKIVDSKIDETVSIKVATIWLI